MEVIGSLVTITQLTDYTFRTIKSIKECYYQIRKQSAKLRQQLSHIERLDLAVKEIKDKPLRSSLVEANLRVIAQTTTQIKEVLELALSKQKTRLFVRFLRASVQQSHQIRLVELFSDLEREKTSLLLGIANSQRDISNRIYQRLIKPARMDEGVSKKKHLKQTCPHQGHSKRNEIEIASSESAYWFSEAESVASDEHESSGGVQLPSGSAKPRKSDNLPTKDLMSPGKGKGRQGSAVTVKRLNRENLTQSSTSLVPYGLQDHRQSAATASSVPESISVVHPDSDGQHQFRVEEASDGDNRGKSENRTSSALRRPPMQSHKLSVRSARTGNGGSVMIGVRGSGELPKGHMDVGDLVGGHNSVFNVGRTPN